MIVVASAIGNFGAVQIEIANEKRKLAMLSKELDLDAIIAMDVDGGGVDRVEFLTAMLVQMNGLSKEKDIDPWLKVIYHILEIYFCDDLLTTHRDSKSWTPTEVVLSMQR